MIYEQFIVSIVELIMLSWQPVLSYNFHNMTVTWLFYYFFKLQVDILHGLENISIFNIWKLWLVRCDVIFGETSVILPKISESFWSKGIPLWWFPVPTLKLNNSKTAWPISAIYISFSSILKALSYEMNMFSHCSSPLRVTQISNYKITKDLLRTQNVRSRLEVRPMHAKINISRGKGIEILLRNLKTMKELTVMQGKDMDLALGAAQGVRPMVVNLKGLCRWNVNIENQQETCLQIGTYVGLTISFFIQITLTIVSDFVTLEDKSFSLPVIIKLMKTVYCLNKLLLPT